jgi:NAD(P)-dependent dehydrogenase (short-subunit alcohol dehydrogenase family)
MQVRNHNIVVTGGAGGLGREVALSLAAAGAAIAIVDLNEAGAAAVVQEIVRAGGRAAAVCGDLTRKAPAHDLFRRAAEALGRINGLVNCAGVYPRRPILEISDEDWDFSFQVNVRGLYHMSVAAVEHMRGQGGGRIVNVASIDAFKAHPKNAHYAAMKAAVVSLTKSLGEAVAPDKVLVNGVAPGAIATDKAKASGFLKEVIAETPIGFAAEPRDIADVIQFLVSEQNRFMVGETVVVSGGYFIP